VIARTLDRDHPTKCWAGSLARSIDLLTLEERLGVILLRYLVLLLACAAMIALPAGDASAGRRKSSPTIEVPLTIHVASEAGEQVVSDERIFAAVQRANLELVEFDIVLWVRAIEVLPMEDGARVETSEQRFALAREAARDGSIHVFYVDGLRLTNPAKGDRRVSGMHWRYRGASADIRRREYVAVAHNAPSTTLVHEVGHAFGLRHEDDFDNLMCSCRRGRRPTFTDQQGQRLRGGARRFLKRAE
jgi:hypothetical protein